jgi:hypothetical protein
LVAALLIVLSWGASRKRGYFAPWRRRFQASCEARWPGAISNLTEKRELRGAGDILQRLSPW